MENRENQTNNTDEMVTISRAEYEQLQQEKAQMESTLSLIHISEPTRPY